MAGFIPIHHASAASIQCECILWLRQVQGVNVHGDAWTIQPNAPLAQASLGDVLLLSYNEEHGAEIVGFDDWVTENGVMRPQTILIVEANFKRCQVTNRRIAWNDPAIRGLYHPPQSTVQQT